MNKPVTVLTGAEWAARLDVAAVKADQLLPQVMAMTNGPGEAVLVGLLMARAMCAAEPRLPDFRWYVARIAEIPDPEKVS